MKSLYLECNAGISGDMTVAALLDAGADEEKLKKALVSIPLEDFSVEISRVKKNAIDCCDFNVRLSQKYENHDHDMEFLHPETHTHSHEDSHNHEHDHEHTHQHIHEEEHIHSHEHRGLNEIKEIISKVDMEEKARNLALKIFTVLAEAEAKAHGTTIEEVHFHEVGAVDSIVDIIALAVCFESLNVEKVFVPYINEGSGTIHCAHGILNVPVPAVTNIVEKYGIPLSIMNVQGEFVTPTGAAFIASVKTDEKLPENFKILKTGLGAGKRNYERPSIVRAFVIEHSEEKFQKTSDENSIVKLETNIDDSNGETLGFVMELLFEAGAREVNFIPCFMKKNRPAYFLNVICMEEKIPELEAIIFKHTSTIGIRRTKMERDILERKVIEIDSEWGKASVKICSGFGVQKCYPEFESIKKICIENNLDYNEVYTKLKSLGEKECLK